MIFWSGVVSFINRLRHEDVPPPPEIDPQQMREELTRTDPDFAHVRRVQHDALQPLTAKGIRDGLALRREREFWQQHGKTDA